MIEMLKNRLNVFIDCGIKFFLFMLVSRITWLFIWDYPYNNFWQAYFFIVLLIIYFNMNRVIKLFMRKDGLQIELAKIETTKEEILEVQKNIRDSYKNMLHLNVALIESVKRLTWSGPPNYDELIDTINENCKKLNLSDQELNYVLGPKASWEKKDKENQNENLKSE